MMTNVLYTMTNACLNVTCKKIGLADFLAQSPVYWPIDIPPPSAEQFDRQRTNKKRNNYDMDARAHPI